MSRISSFSLDEETRRLLKLLASTKYGGASMTAVIRILVRKDAEEAGIK